MISDITCSICSSNTVGLSDVSNFTENSKYNWEHDSTMRLTGWPKAEVQLRACPVCFHSIIFPKFDTSILYGENGSSVRKVIYESYFSNKIYGDKVPDIKLSEAFHGVSQDFFRFHQVSLLLSKFLQNKLTGVEEIRILDWGGGDGYVSNLYAATLGVVTGVPVKSYIYDYSEWKNPTSNKVGLENLRQMKPFHMIIFSQVLEHSHDPVGMIKTTLPFLENQGFLVCEVPDERLNMVRAILRKKTYLHYHVQHYSRRSLHQLLERSGLKKVVTTYHYKSSYRGQKGSSILGIAQVHGDSLNSKPSTFYEFVSIVCFSLRKLATRIFN